MKKMLCGLASVLVLSLHAGEKENLAEEMLTLSGTPKMLKQASAQIETMQANMIRRMVKDQAAQEKAIEIQNKMSAMVMDEFSWDKMKADFIKLYADVYSEEELRGVIAFYKSPVGQKLLEKTPEMMKASMQLMQKKMMEIMPKVQKLAEELKANQSGACATCPGCPADKACATGKECPAPTECCTKGKCGSAATGGSAPKADEKSCETSKGCPAPKAE